LQPRELVELVREGARKLAVRHGSLGEEKR